MMKSHYILNLGLFQYRFLEILIWGLIMPQIGYTQGLIPRHKIVTYKLRSVVCMVSGFYIFYFESFQILLGLSFDSCVLKLRNKLDLC